jgi:hypothetical protein
MATNPNKLRRAQIVVVEVTVKWHQQLFNLRAGQGEVQAPNHYLGGARQCGSKILRQQCGKRCREDLWMLNISQEITFYIFDHYGSSRQHIR